MRKKKLLVSIAAGALALLMVPGMLLDTAPIQVEAAASSSQIKEQINALKGEKAEIDKKVKDIRSQITGNRNEMSQVVKEKNLIDQEIALIHDQMMNLSEQIASFNRMIADKQDELTAAETKMDELNIKNKERIRAMEEDGNLTYWSVLFKANSFADLLDRINMIDEIATADQRRLKEMSEAAQAVSQAKAELEEDKVEAEAAKEELSVSEGEYEAKRGEADKLLATLKEKDNEFQALLDESEEEQEKLMKDIAAAQKNYDAAKLREWLATSVPETTKKADPGNGNSGSSANIPSSSGWIVPCSYIKFTSPFGYRIHPVYKTRKFHSGVDLAGPAGTPIYASRSGEVTVAGNNSSAGNYVSINHGDGFSSVYMHLTSYTVKAGQIVKQGQLIGYMGSTGVSTGPHLHFGIAYNGNYVNPANYIRI